MQIFTAVKVFTFFVSGAARKIFYIYKILLLSVTHCFFDTCSPYCLLVAYLSIAINHRTNSKGLQTLRTSTFYLFLKPAQYYNIRLKEGLPISVFIIKWLTHFIPSPICACTSVNCSWKPDSLFAHEDAPRCLLPASSSRSMPSPFPL